MNTRVVLSVVLAMLMVVGSAVEASAKGGPGCRPRVVVRYGGPRYCAPAPVVVYRRPACRRPTIRQRYCTNHYNHNHYSHGHHYGNGYGNGYGHHHHR